MRFLLPFFELLLVVLVVLVLLELLLSCFFVSRDPGFLRSLTLFLAPRASVGYGPVLDKDWKIALDQLNIFHFRVFLHDSLKLWVGVTWL